MSIPVSNAGPLIALGRINHLHLLPELFGQVIVPRAVFSEITSKLELPGAVQLKQAVWLQTHVVHDMKSLGRLLLLLEPGESEAIILAQELASGLLMDERQGRAIAMSMGLRVTGTIGILIEANRNAVLPQVRPLLDMLLKSGFYFSTDLYDKALDLADEG